MKVEKRDNLGNTENRGKIDIFGHNYIGINKKKKREGERFRKASKSGERKRDLKRNIPFRDKERETGNRMREKRDILL